MRIPPRFVCQTLHTTARRVGCCGGDRREQPTIQRAAAKPLRPLAPHKANARETNSGAVVVFIGAGRFCCVHSHSVFSSLASAVPPPAVYTLSPNLTKTAGGVPCGCRSIALSSRPLPFQRFSQRQGQRACRFQPFRVRASLSGER